MANELIRTLVNVPVNATTTMNPFGSGYGKFASLLLIYCISRMMLAYCSFDHNINSLTIATKIMCICLNINHIYINYLLTFLTL